MSSQFKQKYSWHMVAWGMALGYMVLHHTQILASPHAPVREAVALPVVTGPSVSVSGAKIDWESRHTPLHMLKKEFLWPVQQRECHLVALSVNSLDAEYSGGQGDTLVRTTLCHIEL